MRELSSPQTVLKATGRDLLLTAFHPIFWNRAGAYIHQMREGVYPLGTKLVTITQADAAGSVRVDSLVPGAPMETDVRVEYSGNELGKLASLYAQRTVYDIPEDFRAPYGELRADPRGFLDSDANPLFILQALRQAAQASHG